MPFIVKFILFLFLVYIIGKILLRYVFPYLIKWWLRRIAKKMNPEAFEKPSGKNRKEGDITIKNMPNTKKNKGKSDEKGEYIDYEEL
ncbi:MAG: hypothetical protein KBB11_06580 [Bacteroidales bacterium]|nr:hypothetical protein [Bacteroidales bacterium]HOY38507.1 hypothetical protein [Bacteroidales bacterium]